ncbi:DUF4214 domain-containing protein [Candidatus Poribacteria bacterium]|nr:DUF4214 domain-containing protein [Candidatus Poribacteria bacterium]
MFRPRNASAENGSVDTELYQSDPEDLINDVNDIQSKDIHQIKALIHRICEISHYRIFDDVDFLIEAIGKKDYEGSPALDVLPSHEDTDRERREKIKEYIYCLECWAEGKELDDAVSEFKVGENFLKKVYLYLGELDEDKKELAKALSVVLKEKSSSPDDVLAEISDEHFVNHVYKTVLGRKPEDDDMRLRLMELERGKTRNELIKDILESRESHRKMLLEIAMTVQKDKEKEPEGTI